MFGKSSTKYMKPNMNNSYTVQLRTVRDTQNIYKEFMYKVLSL